MPKTARHRLEQVTAAEKVAAEQRLAAERAAQVAAHRKAVLSTAVTVDPFKEAADAIVRESAEAAEIAKLKRLQEAERRREAARN